MKVGRSFSIALFAFVNFQQHLASALFIHTEPFGTECFSYELPHSDALVGSYEIQPETDQLVVSVFHDGAASPVLLTKYADKSQGVIRVAAVHSEGESMYRVCFKSSMPHEATLSFHIRSSSHQESDVATADHAKDLAELVGRMEERVEELMDQQEYTTTREALHRQMSEKTNARVMWWTMGQVGILAVVSLFQIYYVKSLFEVKTIV